MEDIIKNIEPTRKVIFEKTGQSHYISEYLVDVLRFLNKTEFIKTKEETIDTSSLDLRAIEMTHYLQSGITVPKLTKIETFYQYCYDNYGKIIIALKIFRFDGNYRLPLIQIHNELYRFLKKEKFGNLKDNELREKIQKATAIFDNRFKNTDVQEIYQEKHWDEAETKIKQQLLLL